MFCAVFGHLQNLFSGTVSEAIYRTIYIFHMPAFIFVTGRFAKFSPRKILTRQLLPYGVFQVLYITGDHLIRGDPWELQFTTPRWLLWYLLASAFWHLLLPLLETERPARMAAAACWIALLVCLAPRVKIPLVSTAGENTMPVFLLHGFAVRVIGSRGLFSGGSELKNLLLALVLSFCLMALFGNPWISRLTKRRRTAPES